MYNVFETQLFSYSSLDLKFCFGYNYSSVRMTGIMKKIRDLLAEMVEAVLQLKLVHVLRQLVPDKLVLFKHIRRIKMAI